MATASFVQDGKSIDYTPSSAVSAGDVVVLNDLVAVARKGIAAGELGALAVEGVFDFPKDTGTSTGIAVGKVVYWDVADQEAKEDDESGANERIGITVAAASDSASTVRVKLDPA